MGRWDKGNFDSDTAADYLSDITGGWLEEIREAVANPEVLEADEFESEMVPCAIELLCVMAEKEYVGSMLPEPAEVEEWRDVYIKVWKESIEDLEPVDGFVEERLEVLNATFDRLLELCRERERD